MLTIRNPQQLIELRTNLPPALPLEPKRHHRHSKILGVSTTCPQLVPKTPLTGSVSPEDAMVGRHSSFCNCRAQFVSGSAVAEGNV